MVVEVAVREVSPDSMVHAPEIWMIRPASVRARAHELIDQGLQGGHILRPDRRWRVERLGRALDMGRPWEEVENELPHDRVVRHTGNGRTRIVVVRHAHLIAEMSEHFRCRQAPPERWLCWIEARQAIEKLFAVLGVLDRPHEVGHQATSLPSSATPICGLVSRPSHPPDGPLQASQSEGSPGKRFAPPASGPGERSASTRPSRRLEPRLARLSTVRQQAASKDREAKCAQAGRRGDG
jgi:hypothetical protein